MDRLERLGWCRFFSAQLEGLDADRALPGRVVADHGQELRVSVAAGDVTAALQPAQGDGTERPTVGDWVLVAPDGPRGRHRVTLLLRRRSVLLRKVAGAVTAAQALAANVDVVFVVMGLDGDANPRRLERWTAAVWECGAEPVVLLNKADLLSDADAVVAEVAAAAPGVAVHVLSARTGTGTGVIAATLGESRTGVLAGSSGVGKSTLVNHLLGEDRQPTATVCSRDGRGRHTTASRELFLIPQGGSLIDGPGIRELQLWDADDGVAAAFPDIAALAACCRFRDCAHEGEPGCAVSAAVADGRLDGGRVASLHKLRRELDSLELRRSGLARQEERRRWRAIHKSMRSLGKRS